MSGGDGIRIGLIGAGGYGGAETARWLLRHPRFELAVATGRRTAGRRLADVHPFLEGATDRVIEDRDPAAVAADVDALVFALPHGKAADVMPAVLEAAPDVRVVDLSGDFRLDDADAWAEAYGRPHPSPGLCGAFVYGFTEAHRADLAGARLVANPGCFATAAAAALFPLASRGLLRGEAVVFGVTGSSGSGADPKETTHHPERFHDFKAYRPLAHQHVPEIERLLRESGAEDPSVSFVPHSGPWSRGIFVTATALLETPADPIALDGLVREVWAGEPFVRVRTGSPRVGVVAGTNFVDVAATVRDRRAVMMAALDNLGKGMASQGIQNLNLMFGLPETTGLVETGSRP